MKSGDTLIEIAQRHDTTVSSICNWNRISRRKPIYPGQKLVLWLPTTSAPSPSSNPAGAPATGTAPSTTISNRDGREVLSGKKAVEHIVKRGESIARIAKRYRISPGKIIEWNNLNPDRYIYPGDELILWID